VSIGKRDRRTRVVSQRGVGYCRSTSEGRSLGHEGFAGLSKRPALRPTSQMNVRIIAPASGHGPLLLINQRNSESLRSLRRSRLKVPWPPLHALDLLPHVMPRVPRSEFFRAMVHRECGVCSGMRRRRRAGSGRLLDCCMRGTCLASHRHRRNATDCPVSRNWSIRGRLRNRSPFSTSPMAFSWGGRGLRRCR
jgi:hypothetical protein